MLCATGTCDDAGFLGLSLPAGELRLYCHNLDSRTGIYRGQGSMDRSYSRGLIYLLLYALLRFIECTLLFLRLFHHGSTQGGLLFSDMRLL
jgi:hypothetical protein